MTADSSSKNGPAAAVVHARLAEQVAEVRRLDPLVRSDAPDAVHRMRVALRRLRSALASYRPLLHREVTDPLRDELRWLAQAFGDARDTEVMHERLERLLAEEPRENVRGEVRSQVGQHMKAAYGEAHARCVEAMDSPRYVTLLERLDELVTEPPFSEEAGRQARSVLPDAVRHDWRRLKKDVEAVDAADDAAERVLRLHAVRKASKRVRYAAEPLTDLYGKDARRFVEAVTLVQSSLGEHHDSTMTREQLRLLASKEATEGSNGFTFGVLHAREEANAARAEAEFRKAWRAVSDKKLRRWLG